MADAFQIVKALGGKWTARGAMVRCPAHDDRSPSMSVSLSRDGRPLVYCFAGCSQQAVIAALRAKGLWDGDAVEDPSLPGYLSTRRDGLDREERQRREAARSLYAKARPFSGSLAEIYLRTRGLRLTRAPQSLRFVPSLRHSRSDRNWPCMLGAIRDRDGTVTAVQRTYLAPDGKTKAPVEGAKLSLGPMGNGAVRLSEPHEVLGLAEGIETALSASELYCIPVWATLSAGRLGTIDVPSTVRDVVIFADSGKAGIDGAFKAQDIYEERGLSVEVITPAAHFQRREGDFNDVLRG